MTSFTTKLIGFALAGLLSVNVLAQDIQLLPEDEASRDLSLLEFREQLLEIVQNKDSEALASLLDERVSVSGKSRGSVKEFNKFWMPELKNSEVWPTLKTVLNMGGSFVRSERGVKFCAPYVFTTFPSGLDIYGHGTVINENVPLKAAPSETASNLAELSYHIVKVKDWRSVPDVKNPEVRWLKVKTLGGQEGFINKRMIRSPSDYSLCVLHRSTIGWKIISLIGNE